MARTDTMKAPRLARITFREKSAARLGAVGAVGIVVLLLVAFNLHAVLHRLNTYPLGATFAEAGGLKPGDTVRVGGTEVGTVSTVELHGNSVRVDFRMARGIRLNGGTRAQIKTATLLGTKYLGLMPQGPGVMKAGDRIPLARTRSAYDLTQTLGELSRTAKGLDSRELAKALDAAVGTFQRTPTQFGRTLEGLSKLSDSISSRDDELREVFARTANLTTQLNQRTDQVERILVDGNLLATELVQQRMALDEIIQRLQATLDQLDVFVKNGKEHLTPALHRLKDLLALVLRNRESLEQVLDQTGLVARSLGDVIGSGPFYTASLGNFLKLGLTPIQSSR